MSQGCVQILSDLLGESSMVMMALEGIERVLSVGDLRVMRNAIASHSHADPDQVRRFVVTVEIVPVVVVVAVYLLLRGNTQQSVGHESTWQSVTKVCFSGGAKNDRQRHFSRKKTQGFREV